LISLFDEGKDHVELCQIKKPANGLVNFFISRFVIDDFFSSEGDNIFAFASDRVAHYFDELREDAAYSANLKRVETLTEMGQYLAAIVFLISAFETSMKDIFFHSNDLWFFRLNTASRPLMDRFGTKLKPGETSNKRTTVCMGDDRWSFTDEEYNQVKIWENLEYRNTVFRICRQLGILGDYLLRLYANYMHEIGDYEILKKTLESQGTQCIINFQMIEGKGGIQWAFGKFIGIEFKEVEQDLKKIKDAISIRHRIIHGFLDEKKVTEAYVKDVEASVKRVVAYIRNEILEWSYVL
jgi:hypothetical protein